MPRIESTGQESWGQMNVSIAPLKPMALGPFAPAEDLDPAFHWQLGH